MSKWISIKDQLPEPRYKDRDISFYVWITDGKIIEIAKYIHRPRTYGCAVDDDEEVATCGPEPHWHPDSDGSAFNEGDKCFGRIENADITHWMPLPIPPENTLSVCSCSNMDFQVKNGKLYGEYDGDFHKYDDESYSFCPICGENLIQEM